MKNLIKTLILALFLISCKTEKKPIQFIYLDKLSAKVVDSDSDRGNSGFGEVILIDNPPIEKDSLLAIEKAYFASNNKICLLNEKKKHYAMTFYKKTSCTEYFIDHENDYGGFSRTVISEDCNEDELLSLFYERDKKNPKLWIANMGKDLFGHEYHDTIYCDSSHKKTSEMSPKKAK